MIGVTVVQIDPFYHSSKKNEIKFVTVNTGTWEVIHQLMSYFARKHLSWLWPAAVLINSKGILIVASDIYLFHSATFHSSLTMHTVFLPSKVNKLYINIIRKIQIENIQTDIKVDFFRTYWGGGGGGGGRFRVNCLAAQQTIRWNNFFKWAYFISSQLSCQ